MGEDLLQRYSEQHADSKALARQGFNVTGVDLSPNSIRQAKLHAISQNLNISYFFILLADITY